jgi:[protein-PII] uridylyltransferase
MALVRQTYDRTGDGTAAIRRRSSVVDRLLIELWRRAFGADAAVKASMLALGGYGRKDLFPFSDIDVLFAFADDDRKIRPPRSPLHHPGHVGHRPARQPRHAHREGMYPLRPRQPRIHPFHLRPRFLAGSFPLYQKLHNETFPGLVLSEWNQIAQKLGEIARARHAKYGNTIFHLEPNLKECPGGLRDFNLAPWFALLFHLKEHKEWPKQRGADDRASR